MEKEYWCFDGAKIERGVVEESVADGYRVRSYGRSPLVTPPITAMDSTDSYSVGESVIFFLFDDGYGRIIGKL